MLRIAKHGAVAWPCPSLSYESGRGCPLLRTSNDQRFLIDPSKLACFPFFWKGTHVGLSAAVERGPSQGARSGSTGPTWVSFPSIQACSVSLQGWGLIDLPLRASNEGWFIWSISSIWLVGSEIHPEEPDRPERPANQTDEPARVPGAQDLRGCPSHHFYRAVLLANIP